MTIESTGITYMYMYLQHPGYEAFISPNPMEVHACIYKYIQLRNLTINEFPTSEIKAVWCILKSHVSFMYSKNHWKPI